MVQRTIPTQTIPGDNVERFSVTRAVPDITKDVQITLTDPGDWDTQGPGTFWWGVQFSSNGGASWMKLVSNEPDGQPIRSRAKNGTMPALGISGDTIAALPNGICRLFLRCSAQCRVGATIELL